MPDNARRSSVCAAWERLPIPRFVPPPTISSGCPSAAAPAMISRSSFRSEGRQVVTGRLYRPVPTNGPVPAFRLCLPAASESRQLGMRELASMHMHPTELGTAMQLRKHLARIEKPLGIERAFDALLLLQVLFAEHRAHEVALLDADPMLAGKDPADLDAEPQDVGPERLGALQLARVVGVVE